VTPPAAGDPGRAARRRSILFLVRFVVLLGAFAFLVAWRPVNDHAIVPFTAGVARASAAVLNALSENVSVSGTQIRAAGFSVDVENGCNGVETALLFGSAVLAFPSSWRAKLVGLALGFLAIQILNLVRVVTLFWIGHHRPALFSAAHTVLWQSAVVIAGVLLFLLWASRQRDPARPAQP
jgi:exosortase H (IPTLxxWG-CTERM-specific)